MTNINKAVFIKTISERDVTIYEQLLLMTSRRFEIIFNIMGYPPIQAILSFNHLFQNQIFLHISLGPTKYIVPKKYSALAIDSRFRDLRY